MWSTRAPGAGLGRLDRSPPGARYLPAALADAFCPLGSPAVASTLGAGCPEPHEWRRWVGRHRRCRKRSGSSQGGLGTSSMWQHFPCRHGSPWGAALQVAAESAHACSEWTGRAAHAAGSVWGEVHGVSPLPQRRCSLPGAGQQTALEDRPWGWAVLTSLGTRGPCGSPGGPRTWLGDPHCTGPEQPGVAPLGSVLFSLSVV